MIWFIKTYIIAYVKTQKELDLLSTIFESERESMLI